MKVQLEQMLRPRVERLLAGVRSARDAAVDVSLGIREKVEEPGGIRQWIELPVSKVQWLKDVVVDVSSYTVNRVKTDHQESSEHLSHALRCIVIDSAHLLIEAKKNAAVCMADHKRLLKTAEAEMSSADEWTCRAAKAEEGGHHDLAREAIARAEAHERLAEHARSEADRLGPQVESLKRELRSFNEAIEKARVTLDSLRATELSRTASVRVEQQLHRIQAIGSILATMTATQHGRDNRQQSEEEEEALKN